MTKPTPSLRPAMGPRARKLVTISTSNSALQSDAALPSAVPRTIEAAFARHATLGTPQVARLLQMDIKTLRKHVAAGQLVGRYKGLGRKRRHRVFTLDDVTRFLNHPDRSTFPR